MARRKASRQRAAQPTPATTRPSSPLTASRAGRASKAGPSSVKRRAARLSSIVSALRARLHPRKRRAAIAPTQASAPSSGRAQRTPPLQRRSVVRKPARGPSVQTSRATAAAKRTAGTGALARSSRSLSSTQPRMPPLPQQAYTPTTGATPQRSLAASPGRSSQGASAPLAQGHMGREAQFSIPTGYGDHRIVLMVKDPWWLYAYWEIQPSAERAVRGQLLPHEIAGLQSVLRVYDVTDRDFPTQPAHRWFDIPLSGLATNWYIQTNAPDHTFVVELGLLTQQGRFLLLVRSNAVATPRFGPSDVIDEAWATTDEQYWALFGTSAGLDVGSSPSGWAHAISQRLLRTWSSMSLLTSARAAHLKGFWCRVNADLVIHGSTDPKATVRIQGQLVSVREDGSFSLRLTLPEGAQTITVEATSSDGQQTKTITPIISMAWSGALAPETLRSESHQPRPRSEPLDTGSGSA